MMDERIAALCQLYSDAALAADNAVRMLGANPTDAKGLEDIFQVKQSLAQCIATSELTLTASVGNSPLNAELKLQWRQAQETALRSENRLAEVLNNLSQASLNKQNFGQTQPKNSGKKLDISN